MDCIVFALVLILAAALSLSGCGGSSDAENDSTTSVPIAAGENAAIAAICPAPWTQIVTDEDGNKEPADTFIYSYEDGAYYR